MNFIKYICIFFLISSYSWGQKLSVKVTDVSDRPIHGMAVFIPELKKGVFCSPDGQFSIPVDNGDYTLVCNYPEYKQNISTVSVSGKDSLFIAITLEKDSLYTANHNQKQINNIVRNSINAAYGHHFPAQWYKSNFYLTGKLNLSYINRLVDKARYMIDQFHLSELTDKTLTQEMYSEMEYFYPSHYIVRTKGSRGNIPEFVTQKGAIDILRGSIYGSHLCGSISPLSKGAFRFYKFSYEGYYITESGKRHKIKVHPRYKDPQLVEGYLYIDDGSWTVTYVKLENQMNGLDNSITILYHQIEDNLYLPVTYFNEVDFGFIGVKGKVVYNISLQYDEISGKPKVIPHTDSIRVQEAMVDSTVYKRDEAYWRNLEPYLPNSDTIRYATDTITFDKEKINPSKYLLGKIILGDYIVGNKSSDFSFRYNGMKMIFRDYNYVDGFWLGNRFDLKQKLRHGKNIEAYPYIYYITGRNRILAGSDITHNYSKKRKGQFTLSLSTRTEDFNNLSVTRYQNYFASLVYGENYNFFYQKDQVSVKNALHITPKIKMAVSFGIEKRYGLSNNTDFNLFNRDQIKRNIFPDDRFDRTYYSAGLYYSPSSDYSITEAVDMYERRVTPVFHLEYQEGFSSWQTNNSTYRKLKGGISHNIRLDHFNSVDYKIESGVYFERGKDMHFADYQHFGASDLLLNLNSLFDSFLLLDNYELQTNRYWVNLFLNYSGRYVLFKRLSFLQGKPFTENLHLKTLFTPDIDSYVETGYSVSFNRYFGIGGFTSFHNTKLKKIGIRFSLNLRSLKFT